MKTSNYEKLMAVYIVILILTIITFGFVKPYFEAKAFNECTGGNASYMTAVFSDLRIQDCKR